jgi:uncharacterized protein (DUF305 family)
MMKYTAQRLILILSLGLITLLAACAGASQTTAPAASDQNSGMEHNMSDQSDAPYDALFIDSMIVHHQGAIDMANQALKEATKPEIKTLAENIIKAQEAEIAQMKEWRQAWYSDLAETAGMEMDMGTMEVSTDTSRPFDQRFIEAMIPHHEGAIGMAKDAQQKAEHQEIKKLADAIITAQEAEIAQMNQWLKDWYGQ